MAGSLLDIVNLIATAVNLKMTADFRNQIRSAFRYFGGSKESESKAGWLDRTSAGVGVQNRRLNESNSFVEAALKRHTEATEASRQADHEVLQESAAPTGRDLDALKAAAAAFRKELTESAAALRDGRRENERLKARMLSTDFQRRIEKSYESIESVTRRRDDIQSRLTTTRQAIFEEQQNPTGLTQDDMDRMSDSVLAYKVQMDDATRKLVELNREHETLKTAIDEQISVRRLRSESPPDRGWFGKGGSDSKELSTDQKQLLSEAFSRLDSAVTRRDRIYERYSDQRERLTQEFAQPTGMSQREMLRLSQSVSRLEETLRHTNRTVEERSQEHSRTVERVRREVTSESEKRTIFGAAGKGGIFGRGGVFGRGGYFDSPGDRHDDDDDDDDDDQNSGGDEKQERRYRSRRGRQRSRRRMPRSFRRFTASVRRMMGRRGRRFGRSAGVGASRIARSFSGTARSFATAVKKPNVWARYTKMAKHRASTAAAAAKRAPKGAAGASARAAAASAASSARFASAIGRVAGVASAVGASFGILIAAITMLAAAILALNAFVQAVKARAMQEVERIKSQRSTFSASITGAGMMYDLQTRHLEARSTRATAATSLGVIESTRKLREATQPQSEKWENIANQALITVTDIATAVAKGLNTLDEMTGFTATITQVMNTIQEYMKWLGYDVTEIKRQGQKDGENVGALIIRQFDEANRLARNNKFPKSIPKVR